MKVQVRGQVDCHWKCHILKIQIRKVGASGVVSIVESMQVHVSLKVHTHVNLHTYFKI